MNNQKITVVISCYNHSQYLKQSIQSIQNQTWKNLDIVVVDDCSDDADTVASIVNDLAKNDDRIRFIPSTENHGKWWCLNKAIETSDAPIVTSHDADDVSLVDRIERQYLAMQDTGSLHNLCGFYHCYNEDDVSEHADKKVTGNRTIATPDKVAKMVSFGIESEGINHYFTGDFETAGVSGMFYKKIWDMGIRFNPPGMGLRILNSEDSDFNARMTLFTGKTSVLVEKLYCYRRNTSTNNEMK